jgi:hypothetical protein
VNFIRASTGRSALAVIVALVVLPLLYSSFGSRAFSLGGDYTSPNTGVTLTPAQVAADLGGGVYSFTGTIDIRPNDTLVIPAGTTLLATGTDPLANLIRIRGSIVAEGSAGAPIVFRHSLGGAGRWLGISVMENGRTALLRHVSIRNMTRFGLDIQTHPDRSVTLGGLSFADGQGTGLSIAGGNNFDRLEIDGLASERCPVTLTLNTVSGVAVKNLVVSEQNGPFLAGEVRAAVRLTQSSSDFALIGATIAGNGLYADTDPAGGRALDNDSILIENATFTGTSADTAISLRRSLAATIRNSSFSGHHIGVRATNVAGLVLDRVVFSNCGTAILVDGAHGLARPESIPHAGRLVYGAATADDWDVGADYFTNALPLGFNFPLAGRTFTHHRAKLHGAIELLGGGGAVVYASPHTSRAQIIEDTPAAAAIFAFSEELTAENMTGETDVTGYGYRLFSPAEPDTLGVIPGETVGVFLWNLLTVSDSATPANVNRVAVHLYPNGRIRWFHTALGYKTWTTPPVAGFYLPEGRECLTAVLPRSAPSAFEYAPETGVRTESPLLITGSTLTGNRTAIAIDRAIRALIDATTITGNETGVVIGLGADSVTIRGSNLVANSRADLAVLSTTGAISLVGNYLGPSPIITGNTNLVTLSGTVAAPITSAPYQINRREEPSLCLATRLFGGIAPRLLSPLRTARDLLLETAAGRLLVGFWYRI